MTTAIIRGKQGLSDVSGTLATVGVEDVAYEPRTGRFTAIVVAPERQGHG